eukprot:Lithocolla_globosa_v1_NODE_7608_length_924_cov_14.385501.p1 type:complete len:214 gc:universal NODE_7608_length_924_cov_14.385501:872-231(-)
MEWEAMSREQKEREVARMWRIRKTVLKMVSDRDYLVSQAERDQTLAQFSESFFADGESFDRDSLTILVCKKDDVLDQLFAFFPAAKQLGIKVIEGYVERMKEAHAQRSIIVFKEKITGQAKQALALAKTVEQFCEDELLINITEHTLVPQHQVLTDEEKKTLLQRYRLKEYQLPRIQESDPIARYYGLRKSQAVKIIRPSETAGRYVTYRLVS